MSESSNIAVRRRALRPSECIGEFDPGSGRTLAACLIHASRAREAAGILREEGGRASGERVSNTWTTSPADRDNFGKPELIPDGLPDRLVRQ